MNSSNEITSGRPSRDRHPPERFVATPATAGWASHPTATDPVRKSKRKSKRKYDAKKPMIGYDHQATNIPDCATTQPNNELYADLIFSPPSPMGKQDQVYPMDTYNTIGFSRSLCSIGYSSRLSDSPMNTLFSILSYSATTEEHFPIGEYANNSQWASQAKDVAGTLLPLRDVTTLPQKELNNLLLDALQELEQMPPITGQVPAAGGGCAADAKKAAAEKVAQEKAVAEKADAEKAAAKKAAAEKVAQEKAAAEKAAAEKAVTVKSQNEQQVAWENAVVVGNESDTVWSQTAQPVKRENAVVVSDENDLIVSVAAESGNPPQLAAVTPPDFIVALLQVISPEKQLIVKNLMQDGKDGLITKPEFFTAITNCVGQKMLFDANDAAKRVISLASGGVTNHHSHAAIAARATTCGSPPAPAAGGGGAQAGASYKWETPVSEILQHILSQEDQMKKIKHLAQRVRSNSLTQDKFQMVVRNTVGDDAWNAAALHVTTKYMARSAAVAAAGAAAGGGGAAAGGAGVGPVATEWQSRLRILLIEANELGIWTQNWKTRFDKMFRRLRWPMYDKIFKLSWEKFVRESRRLPTPNQSEKLRTFAEECESFLIRSANSSYREYSDPTTLDTRISEFLQRRRESITSGHIHVDPALELQAAVRMAAPVAHPGPPVTVVKKEPRDDQATVKEATDEETEMLMLVCAPATTADTQPASGDAKRMWSAAGGAAADAPRSAKRDRPADDKCEFCKQNKSFDCCCFQQRTPKKRMLFNPDKVMAAPQWDKK